jgi:outer membrane protein assembly factor BamB
MPAFPIPLDIEVVVRRVALSSPGLVYIVRFNGVLTVFDAKSGEKKYQERLAGATSAFTSSPVANDGKVYIASEDGQVMAIGKK